MSYPAVARPTPDEYAPYYAGYIGRVPDGDPIALLASTGEATRRLLADIGDERAGQPYAPGKWSVKDVIVHISDSERVFSYRALRIARGDVRPLAGFEQDDYVRAAQANTRPLAELLDELASVRASTLALFRGLAAEAFGRRGIASEQPVSVGALLYVIIGHEVHHQRLLAEALRPSAAAATTP